MRPLSKREKTLVMTLVSLLTVVFLAWQAMRFIAQERRPAGRSIAAGAANIDATQPRWDTFAGHDHPQAIRWEGIWYDSPERPSGSLFALVYPDEQGRWRVTFAGYMGSLFKFEAANPGTADGDDILFDGVTAMHDEDDLWHWKGTMTAQSFDGTYQEQSSKRTGGFRMNRWKERPAATQPAEATASATTQPTGSEAQP